MPRGRPKKNQITEIPIIYVPSELCGKNDAESLGIATSDGTYAPIDETKHEHALRQIELQEKQNELYKEVKSWCVILNGKVLKKTLKANGNVSTTFICLQNKANEDLLKKLKKEYEFRV